MTVAMFAVLTVVTPVTVQTASSTLREVNISVTVETPHPALTPALPTRDAPRAPALVAGLDDAGVRDGDQPHLVPEHPARPLLYLPGQGGGALCHLGALQLNLGVGPVWGVAPAGLSSLSKCLELIV